MSGIKAGWISAGTTRHRWPTNHPAFISSILFLSCLKTVVLMPIQLAQPADFADVLALQARYHVSSASPAAMAQGFVTTTLETQTLERMHDARALWVARDEDGQLAAYACAVEWEFYAGSGFVERVFRAFAVAVWRR